MEVFEKMEDLKGKTQEEMEQFALSIGESKFRGRQLFKWIYQRGESDFSKMSDIGKVLRAKLENICYVSKLELEKKIETEKNASANTEKFLFRLSDGNHIESVLMRYEENLGPGRCTICISSQVGCAQGCVFCASGRFGFTRNLTPAEIADQVIQIQNILNETTGERVANVVIMGIGEPLANYANTMKAVNLINHGDGIGIGIRHIALSTVGIPALIKKLAGERFGMRFAVSLHAPNDEIRNKIMPINRKHPISELISACRYYQETAGRRITFEYTLINNLNDSIENARELGRLLQGINAMVNLIPLNPVEHFPYKRPPHKKCQQFADELSKNPNLKVTFRNERGTDIDAACGQLRARLAPPEPK